MSLPVRSPSTVLTTSHNVQPTTMSPTVDAHDPIQEQSQNLPSSIPEEKTDMSQVKDNTPPLSPSQCVSPKPASPTCLSAPIQEPTAAVSQNEDNSDNIMVSESQTQTQQAQAPQLDSPTTPTSNVDTGNTTMQSAKRAREEGDDSFSAFGTPPPKRASRAKAAGNTKNPTKKTAPAKKPAPKKATPKKAATPAPSRSQPSRNRKAPDRFADLEENPTPKALPNKKGCSKVFDPVFITTNSNSRLVKADIYHMLLEGSAWTSLSAEQQTTLISMLPTDSANQALLTKINAGETEDTRPAAFTLANDCFRTDVAKFQEDLKNGHLAKTWQAAAEQAVIERAAGEYDKWKAEEAEAWWGQRSSVNATKE